MPSKHKPFKQAWLMVQRERDNTLIVTITRLLCAESIERRAATYLHLQMASYDLLFFVYHILKIKNAEFFFFSFFFFFFFFHLRIWAGLKQLAVP